MPRRRSLHSLTNNAAETLQRAFVECREASTEGHILAALAMVAELQDALSNSGPGASCGKACRPC